MTDFWRQPFRKQVGLAAAAAVMINGGALLVQWYAASPYGYGGLLLLQTVVLFALPLFVATFAIPLAVLVLPFSQRRRSVATVLVCSIVYACLGYWFFSYSWTIRRHGFEQLAESSQPLIDGIERFIADKGRPPVDLAELTPRYLPSVPTTGMPAYPEYRYSTDADRWDGNPWVVYVNCSSGGINFDMFVYFPRQNYPRRGYGGSLSRIGKWAYVHE